MENAARAVIGTPKLLLPLFAVIFAVLLWWVPQLVLLGIVVVVVWARRRAKQHRFDTYVAEVLKPHDPA